MKLQFNMAMGIGLKFLRYIFYVELVEFETIALKKDWTCFSECQFVNFNFIAGKRVNSCEVLKFKDFYLREFWFLL